MISMKINEVDNNYYVMNNLVFSTKTKLYKYIDSTLKKGIYEFDFRYEGKENATKLSSEIARYILDWMRNQGRSAVKVTQRPNDSLGVCKLEIYW